MHIEWSMQAINKDKYMSSVMKMMIMCYVYHLNMEMEGKHLQIMPKSTPRNINNFLLQAEFEKEEFCLLVVRGISIRWKHLILNLIMYIVQKTVQSCIYVGLLGHTSPQS